MRVEPNACSLLNLIQAGGVVSMKHHDFVKAPLKYCYNPKTEQFRAANVTEMSMNNECPFTFRDPRFFVSHYAFLLRNAEICSTA